MTVRVFKTKSFIDSVRDHEPLADEFKKLKSCENFRSVIYGKDVPFDYPPNVKLSNIHHIHIVKANHLGQIPYTSDRFLVYAQSFNNPSIYVILGVIEPPAHQAINNVSLLESFAARAEEFHKHVSHL